ncbi:hypothetical protein [Streptomyces griseoviridis]|uniref:hypothetical protein n=1 Tax=Streptomyces griseoviridis TaxID=45398 RepID=UPI00345121AB
MAERFDSRFLREAYSAVPEIGEGRRWYDWPYKTLLAAHRSYFGRRLPRPVRARILDAINHFHPFHEHDVNRVWSRDDPTCNLHVPDDERVQVPGIWVVELFPPSQYSNLDKGIRRNAWDKRRVRYGIGEANLEVLEQSRAGEGWRWWKLGEVKSRSASWSPYPDGRSEDLGEWFTAIELVAVQIGAGLTAVLAHFTISPAGSSYVDSVWHSSHEPEIVRGNGRPRAENRMWVAFRKTQEARESLHEAARSWLARALPGAFAAAGEKQPLLDILLFDSYDPLLEEPAERELLDNIRALGLSGGHGLHRTTESLPGLVFEPLDTRLCPSMGRNSFALFGKFEKVAAGIPNLRAYSGERDGRAIANYAHRKIRNLSVLLSVSTYLDLIEAQYARLRDEARIEHGNFKARNLKLLRSNFLTLSLDLSSLARDIAAYNSRVFHLDGESEFFSHDSPWLTERFTQAGRTPRERINLNDQMRRSQAVTAERMLIVDRDYRDILSTVSSLGSSVDASKLGRIALWVSLLSLVVSLIALGVAEIGDNSVFQLIWQRLS